MATVIGKESRSEYSTADCKEPDMGLGDLDSDLDHNHGICVVKRSSKKWRCCFAFSVGLVATVFFFVGRVSAPCKPGEVNGKKEEALRVVLNGPDGYNFSENLSIAPPLPTHGTETGQFLSSTTSPPLPVQLKVGQFAGTLLESGTTTKRPLALTPVTNMDVETYVANHNRPTLVVNLMGGIGNQIAMIATLLSLAKGAGGRISIALPDVSTVCCTRKTYWDSIFQSTRPLLVPAPSPYLKTPQECMIKETRVQTPPAMLGVFGADHLGRDGFQVLAEQLEQKMRICHVVKLDGYFQHPGLYLHNFDHMHGLFWDPASARIAERTLAGMLPLDSKSVSMHFRFTDRSKDELGDRYFENAIRQANTLLPGHGLVIFSDEPAKAMNRCKRLPDKICHSTFFVPRSVSDVTSFYMMAMTNANIISHSSFSFWAALLGTFHRRHKGIPKSFVITPSLCGHNYKQYSVFGKSPFWAADAVDVFNNISGVLAEWRSIRANTTTWPCT